MSYSSGTLNSHGLHNRHVRASVLTTVQRLLREPYIIGIGQMFREVVHSLEDPFLGVPL